MYWYESTINNSTYILNIDPLVLDVEGDDEAVGLEWLQPVQAHDPQWLVGLLDLHVDVRDIICSLCQETNMF